MNDVVTKILAIADEYAEATEIDSRQALQDELKKVCTDAARYQWLKNMFGWHILRDYLVDVEATNNLDRVIDTAMEPK